MCIAEPLGCPWATFSPALVQPPGIWPDIDGLWVIAPFAAIWFAQLSATRSSAPLRASPGFPAAALAWLTSEAIVSLSAAEAAGTGRVKAPTATSTATANRRANFPQKRGRRRTGTGEGAGMPLTVAQTAGALQNGESPRTRAIPSDPKDSGARPQRTALLFPSSATDTPTEPWAAAACAFCVILLAIPLKMMPWKGRIAIQYSRPPSPWGKKTARWR